MEKGVLLVLLCLSFLLITAFTATDAAALVEDNQRQPRQRLRFNLGRRPSAKHRFYMGCWKRPRGCNIFGEVKPKPIPSVQFKA